MARKLSTLVNRTRAKLMPSEPDAIVVGAAVSITFALGG
jgi:hypothetical protein